MKSHLKVRTIKQRNITRDQGLKDGKEMIEMREKKETKKRTEMKGKQERKEEIRGKRKTLRNKILEM